MDSAKIQLTRRVLETLTQGDSASFNDAIRLRNWVGCPEESLLPLVDIARAIRIGGVGKSFKLEVIEEIQIKSKHLAINRFTGRRSHQAHGNTRTRSADDISRCRASKGVRVTC